VVSICEYNTQLFQKIYKELNDQIGLEATLTVYRMFRGSQVNFPQRLLDTKSVRQLIIRRYNGSNTKALAKEYGYSEKTIQRILRDYKKENKIKE
jgi:Mor family transcriptional regulator